MEPCIVKGERAAVLIREVCGLDRRPAPSGRADIHFSKNLMESSISCLCSCFLLAVRTSAQTVIARGLRNQRLAGIRAGNVRECGYFDILNER